MSVNSIGSGGGAFPALRRPSGTPAADRAGAPGASGARGPAPGSGPGATGRPGRLEPAYADRAAEAAAHQAGRARVFRAAEPTWQARLALERYDQVVAYGRETGPGVVPLDLHV